jgi:glucokinase
MAILGVDIGGTQIKAGLVSATGEILRQGRIATPATLAEFTREFPALVRSLGAGDLEGVGIGCKGVIHPMSTRVEVLPGTVHYLEGEHLRDFLPHAPVVVADNDARVALAGEMAWGAARGRRDVLMLTLGTGVGGGIV